MPKLACWSCGRQIYTVAPLEALFAEERRCQRCGASLHGERRDKERRVALRRQNPPDDPGPPAAEPERRIDERRRGRRRGRLPVQGRAAGGQEGSNPGSGGRARSSGAGWVD